jgi:Putative bacterial sensory transduction regulator
MGYQTRPLAAVLLAFAGLVAPAGASAQNVVAQNPQSVVNALQDAGCKAQLGKDNGGDPMITSATSGKNFLILFFGCTKGAACTSIQFYTGFNKTDADLAKVNEWNEGKRFGRAAIDKDGDPVIRMDVDIDLGGISPALFKDHIAIWVVVVNKFAALVGAVEG